jgi:hypothetical protein
MWVFIFSPLGLSTFAAPFIHGQTRADKKVLFCKTEQLAVSLSKVSNRDTADTPELSKYNPSEIFREAALLKLCFFIADALQTSLRTVYRAPKRGGYSVVESRITAEGGKKSYIGFILTRENIPVSEGS